MSNYSKRRKGEDLKKDEIERLKNKLNSDVTNDINQKLCDESFLGNVELVSVAVKLNAVSFNWVMFTAVKYSEPRCTAVKFTAVKCTAVKYIAVKYTAVTQI